MREVPGSTPRYSYLQLFLPPRFLYFIIFAFCIFAGKRRDIVNYMSDLNLLSLHEE